MANFASRGPCSLLVCLFVSLRQVFNFTFNFSASEYKTITHGLGRYPDLVVVQLLLSNGYISEAGGKTPIL